MASPTDAGAPGPKKLAASWLFIGQTLASLNTFFEFSFDGCCLLI
jgi:hypothetical protein